jgi:hypothetical protein
MQGVVGRGYRKKKGRSPKEPGLHWLQRAIGICFGATTAKFRKPACL